MLTICYRIICAACAAFIGVEIFRQKDVKLKINAAIIIIPFIMRALMIV